ncbi:HIT family protein [Nocardia sp. NPDC049149]|uniref:HIT family protein n=1 Tax=Nocardia sp. NPDC049149 TaxID=3364315 RepID=UPI0037183EAF
MVDSLATPVAELDSARAGASPNSESRCLFCCPANPDLNRIAGSWGTVYARWDNFPASPGHLEIVPFRHMLSFFDLTDQEASDLHWLARAMQGHLEQRFRPEGYTIGINDGPASGRSVDHLHLHIIPRYHGDIADPRGGIRRIFPGDPDTWR